MITLNDLPEYKCHKVVRAGKILGVNWVGLTRTWVVDIEGFGEITLADEVLADVTKDVGGYLVVYDGGAYVSYSPAEPFEKGYTLLESQRNEDCELTGGCTILACLAELPAELLDTARDAFFAGYTALPMESNSRYGGPFGDSKHPASARSLEVLCTGVAQCKEFDDLAAGGDANVDLESYGFHAVDTVIREYLRCRHSEAVLRNVDRQDLRAYILAAALLAES